MRLLACLLCLPAALHFTTAALLILDGKLGGWLDQVAGVLHVEEGPSGAAAEARKFNGLSEWAGKLGTIRSNIRGKVVALTD